MEKKEIWKEVEGFEDQYLISSEGRIYSKIKNRLLNPCKNSSKMPHLYIDVKFKTKRTKLYIHRLVAKAFLPNPNNYPEVDHIDCDPTNNNVNNLRWCTRKMNQNNLISIQHQQQGQPTSKPVVQMQGNRLIGVYPSIMSATRHGFTLQGIWACCNHKYRYHKGFKWLYLDEYQKLTT